MTDRRPLILLTPDENEHDTRRGPVPHHHIEKSYGQAVLDAGGLPWVMPYTTDDAVLDEVMARVDGVVLTGGAFDIDPGLFGEAPHEKLGTLKPRRTAFESAVYRRARALDRPVLAVCGGMQLVCALRGGTLWQDIWTQTDTTVPHEQDPPKAAAGHEVTVVADTLFASIVGPETLGVNSTHHQAVRTLPDDLVCSARAPDGIVEAFEDPAAGWMIGVQWHPEAMPAERHQALYRALVDEARRVMARRPGAG